MNIQVIDFFSGCGGTSQGFYDAGMEILAGIDIDVDAAKTYQNNFPNADFICGDIKVFHPMILKNVIKNRKHPLLFSGCAPCQPFSLQNKNKNINDDRRFLLDEFWRFVNYWTPEFVFVENVPGIQKAVENSPFSKFVLNLKKWNIL